MGPRNGSGIPVAPTSVACITLRSVVYAHRKACELQRSLLIIRTAISIPAPHPLEGTQLLLCGWVCSADFPAPQRSEKPLLDHACLHLVRGVLPIPPHSVNFKGVARGLGFGVSVSGCRESFSKGGPPPRGPLRESKRGFHHVFRMAREPCISRHIRMARVVPLFSVFLYPLP